MEKLFVIVEKEYVNNPEDIFVAKAEDSDEALVKFSREYVRDIGFIEDVESRVVNGLFWATFFRSIYFTEDGLDKEIDYNSIDQHRESRLEFEQNIENYFGAQNKSLSEELIRFYNDEDKKYKDLSEKVLNYIGLKEVKNRTDDYVIREVDLQSL